MTTKLRNAVPTAIRKADPFFDVARTTDGR